MRANDKFFVVNQIDPRHSWQAKPDFRDMELTIQYMEGLTKARGPLSVTLSGRRKVDILFCNYTLVFSERVLDIFQENELTGWSTFPIRMKTTRKLDSKYFGLVLTGRVSMIGDSLDPICIERIKWDGSDFCLITNTLLKVVTNRVVQVCHTNNITGLIFKPIKTK